MDTGIRRTLIILLVVTGLIFGLVVIRQLRMNDEQQTAPAPDLGHLNTFVYEEGRPLPDFRLMAETGGAATLEDLKGQWTFVFIGYTFCPDACPDTLATLRQTGERLPRELPEPEYWLLTADPERDTPSRLREYLSAFGDNFHGVTGDLEALRALARSFNGAFVHRDSADGGPLVDHSAHLSLIDPEGQLVALIQPPHQPEQVAEAFGQVYQWVRDRHPRAGTP